MCCDIHEIQRNRIFYSWLLKSKTEYYLNLAASEPTLGRLAGVGKLSKEKALALCAVGPTLRASGVPMDV